VLERRRTRRFQQLIVDTQLPALVGRDAPTAGVVLEANAVAEPKAQLLVRHEVVVTYTLMAERARRVAEHALRVLRACLEEKLAFDNACRAVAEDLSEQG